MNVHACAKLINTGINAHTGTHMQPPVQVVTLVFVFSAAPIDLGMVHAKRKPPPPPPPCPSRSRAKEALVGESMIACGAASPLDDVARQGFNGSAERLCKLRGCTSVRHEVLADCEYEHNHSNKRPNPPHSLRPLRFAPFSCPRVSQSCPLCPLLTPTHTHAFPSPRTPSPRPRLPPPRQPILIRNVSADITSALAHS